MVQAFDLLRLPAETKRVEMISTRSGSLGDERGGGHRADALASSKAGRSEKPLNAASIGVGRGSGSSSAAFRPTVTRGTSRPWSVVGGSACSAVRSTVEL